MKTSIQELQTMNHEDRTMRSLDRIVDRAVLDSKLDRAMSIKWVEAYVETWQASQDETENRVMDAMFGGR